LTAKTPIIQVLDHGFVTLEDHMGSDLTVVNAARVSFSKRSCMHACGSCEDCLFSPPNTPHGCNHCYLGDSDAKLIKYLATNDHWTPFGHPQITLHLKMPIFVARQFMRSNVGIVYNEMSRRYVDSPPEFYTPSEWRSRPDKSIKQGSGAALDNTDQIDARTMYGVLREVVSTYDTLLRIGVAPEMARMVLPLSTYTELWATMSLAAAARLCNLRLDAHAQLEIQVYADAISKLIQPLFPVSWHALVTEKTQ